MSPLVYPGFLLAFILSAGGGRAEEKVAVAPYAPVTIRAAPTPADPALADLRSRIVEAARRKNRRALAALIIDRGFFHEDGAEHDRETSLATLLHLDRDAAGWDMLTGFAAEPSAAPHPFRPGVLCGPADPTYDAAAFDRLLEATETTPRDWAVPARGSVELRAEPAMTAPVIERLRGHLIRVVEGDTESAVRIVAPSGTAGYAAPEALTPLGPDQICYVKDKAGDWKIAGFVGEP